MSWKGRSGRLGVFLLLGVVAGGVMVSIEVVGSSGDGLFKMSLMIR